MRTRYAPTAAVLALSIGLLATACGGDDDADTTGGEGGDSGAVSGEVTALEAVRAALDEDLDGPAALDEIDRAASSGAGVSAALRLLGVPEIRQDA
jgi:hypothetical protein